MEESECQPLNISNENELVNSKSLKNDQNAQSRPIKSFEPNTVPRFEAAEIVPFKK